MTTNIISEQKSTSNQALALATTGKAAVAYVAFFLFFFLTKNKQTPHLYFMTCTHA